MMRYLKIYFRLLSLNISSQMAYRENFFIGFFLTALESATTLLGVSFIFNHIDRIGNWQYGEILVLTGTFMVVNGIAWITFRAGVGVLDRIINRGDFDFFLVKPVDEQFLVSVYRIDAEDTARSFIGFFIIVYGLNITKHIPSFSDMLPFLFVLICGQIILYSLQIALKTVSFKSIQGWATNSIFFRFFEITKFPMDIYRGWLKTIYQFVIPLLFVATVPAKFLLGKGSFALAGGAFLAAVMTFFASRVIWKYAVRRYSSASS